MPSLEAAMLSVYINVVLKFISCFLVNTFTMVHYVTGISSVSISLPYLHGELSKCLYHHLIAIICKFEVTPLLMEFTKREYSNGKVLLLGCGLWEYICN